MMCAFKNLFCGSFDDVFDNQSEEEEEDDDEDND
jgi:hypothetical protein